MSTRKAFQTLQQATSAYGLKMRTRAALIGKEAVAGISDFGSPSKESVQKLIRQFN